MLACRSVNRLKDMKKSVKIFGPKLFPCDRWAFRADRYKWSYMAENPEMKFHLEISGVTRAPTYN